MQSNGTRIAAVLVALAAVIVLFFAFKGDDDESSTTSTNAATTTTAPEDDAGGAKADTPSEPSVPVIKVVGGQPEDGIAELEFNQGDEIRFEVESDTADEVHVHGYDVEEEVPANGSVEFDFAADLEGVFEVELHSSETQIAELTVNP